MEPTVCWMGQGLVITDQTTSPFLLRMAPSQSWAALAILGQRAMELLEVLSIPHPPSIHANAHTHACTCRHTQIFTHRDIHAQQSVSLEPKINELIPSYFLPDFWNIPKKTTVPTLWVEENFNHPNEVNKDFPGGRVVKNPPCNRGCGFDSWSEN